MSEISFRLNTKIPVLALPLILSQITIPLLGLANTIIVGHLGHQYFLGAIGLGTMMFNFLYWGLGFFRMSTTGLMARAHGARNQDKTISLLQHSLCLALFIGLTLIILQDPIYHIFAFFLHSNEQITSLLQQYYFIRIWGAPAVLINFVIVGAMIAIQKTRGPLVTLTITNLTAILLSVWLVFGWHLNLAGVAIGDVLAQYIGMFIGLVILSCYFSHKKVITFFLIQKSQLKALLHANRDIFIRTVCLIIVFTFFTIWSSHISPLILAVNTLLMNFFQFMANALGGFDNVAETLAGQAVGEQDWVKFKECIIQVGAWALIFSLLFCIFYWAFGDVLVRLMTNVVVVAQAAVGYTAFVIALPLIAFLSFLFDGVAIGANLFSQMRNSMILTTLLYFIVWYLLKPFGNSGLWMSFYSFFIFRAIFLGYFIFQFYNNQAHKLTSNI